MHQPLRCFVHIGPPKTGTSYLQSVLWASRNTLADQGLVLPLEQRDHYHLALALRAIHKPTAAARAATVLDRLAAATAAVNGADLLISQEQLAPATPAEAGRLVALLATWEVHIVLTARDIARQVPSEWQQSIKQHRTLRYDDFLETVVARRSAADGFWAHQDLVTVAAQWSSAVPADRVHIVTVPPPGSPPTRLLERFCFVVGADPTLLQTSVAVSNPSLGYAQAELLRRVNEAFGARLSDPDTAAALAQNYLAKKVLAAQSGAAPQMPKRLHDWCREEAARTIAELAASGYDVVGDLNDLMPTFAGSGDVQEVDDTDVIEAAVAALLTTLQRRHAASERAKQLRKRLRHASQRRT